MSLKQKVVVLVLMAVMLAASLACGGESGTTGTEEDLVETLTDTGEEVGDIFEGMSNLEEKVAGCSGAGGTIDRWLRGEVPLAEVEARGCSTEDALVPWCERTKGGGEGYPQMARLCTRLLGK